MHDTRPEADQKSEQLSTVLWHPDLHRQVAQEQLAFLTIGFQPRYQRDTALQVIDRANAVIGVRSYVVWELQRKPDLLVKLWIPAGKNAEDVLQSLLAEAGSQPHLSLDLNITIFVVWTTLSHHLWPRALTPTDIEEALENGGDYLTSGHLAGVLPERLVSLTRRQIMGTVAGGTVGIKFFIWLALSELLPNERARATLESELIRFVNTTPHVYSTSIYSGAGIASYIVSGRFKPENFEVLARELQPRLATLGVPFIATNTDTALSTLFGPIDRVESLLPVEDCSSRRTEPHPGSLQLSSLLQRDESATLEFKGSAFTPIPSEETEPRGRNDAERVNRAKKIRDAITKSCAGFLNSGGGVLVIGVLEAERTPLERARRYNARAAEAGQYIVVGIDPAIDGRPISWDGFERRLRAQLSESIFPSPDPWIQIVRLSNDSIEVAAVIVEEPTTWYWAKTSTDSDVFYVRYGNATRPLRGPAQLHHMRSRPRDE